MANLMPLPKMRFTNQGRPLIGGKVFFYVSGTSTPKNTFKDRNQSTLNSNPVILDSNGEADIWLEVGYYKVALKSSNDVVIWTVDGIAADAQGLNIDDLNAAVTASQAAAGAAEESASRVDLGALDQAVADAQASAAIAAGAVSGLVNTFYAATYDTTEPKATTLAAIVGDGATIIIDRDETRGGLQARYTVASGVPVFVSELEAAQVKVTGGGSAQSELDSLSDRVVALENSEIVGDTTNEAFFGEAAALPSAPAGYKKVFINGVAFLMPFYNLGSLTDLFIIVGQSNAEGRGNSAQSPAAPNGLYISGSTITSPLADPVGGASTGSMWPAFSNEWFAQTGRMAAFVESATGGTALIPNTAGSNWSPSGTLRAAAASAANTAISALNASDDYSLNNVYFVWAQGEQEAESINGTTITGAVYEQALEDLADYFKAQVPSLEQMLVVRTGSRNDRARSADWAAIRAAQEDACTENANLRMVYRGTYSFSADALAYMGDAVHNNQAGLNLAGKCAALESSKVSPSARVAAPALLAEQFFMDTDAAVLVSSRTDSHTTAADTKMLVVALAGVRIASTTSVIPLSVTFNSVPMLKFASAAGANASPTGRSDVAVYYLTETEYGSSLSGVTADIVSTLNTTANIFSVAAYDLDAEGIPEISRPAVISGTTGTVMNTTMTLSEAGFAVAVAASAGDSASALTYTFTGLTEDADAGGSNGTRAGQIGFASDAFAESVDNSVGATVSGTVNAAATLIAAFRGVIDGEI